MRITESKIKQTPAKLCVHFSGLANRIKLARSNGRILARLARSEPSETETETCANKLDILWCMCPAGQCDTSHLLCLSPLAPLCYFCPLSVPQFINSPVSLSAPNLHMLDMCYFNNTYSQVHQLPNCA